LQYDKYWDTIRTERSAYMDAEEKGREEGLAEGEQIGIQKGEQIGMQKVKIELACNAKKMGMSVKDISALTGLSEAEISVL